MSFTADARAKYSEAKPQPNPEPDDRGKAIAQRLEDAIDRPVRFVSYGEDKTLAVLQVDDAIIHVLGVRDFMAGRNLSAAYTLRLALARVCPNLHVSQFPVVHEGLYGTLGVETSRKQRNDFFLNEVGRALTENPTCPTCKEAYA